jgi:hypothetical protein
MSALHGEEGLSGWNGKASHQSDLVDGIKDSPTRIRRYH